MAPNILGFRSPQGLTPKAKRDDHQPRRPVKIRVLHVLHSLAVGGAENGVVNLVNRLDSARFAPGIVTFVPGGKLKARLDVSRVNVIERLNKQPGNDWKLPFRLAQIFHRQKPHIVHTHGWGTLCEGWLAAKIAGIPVWVHGEHGTMQEKHLNRHIQRRLWGLADGFLSVSEVLAERLAVTMCFPRERIHTIINGVDLACFQPRYKVPEEKIARLRISSGIPLGTFSAGAIGRLEPVKDHATFLQAIAYATKRCNNLNVIIIGTGSQRCFLERQIERLGLAAHVKLLGERHDLAELMHIMDTFVLSSRSEGLSNTVLEAMASAIPVLATDVGGNSELVENGRTGLLVPPGSPEALGEALIHLARHPGIRRQMGKASRKRAESYFSLDRMVADYEAYYTSLMESKAAIPKGSSYLQKVESLNATS